MHGNLVEQFHNEVIQVNGISTDLRIIDTFESQYFVLRLERNVDLDLFHALCSTLIDSTASIKDSSVALSVIFSHLKRWKAFLAGRPLRILTPEQQRGLFCEIKYLQKLLTGILGEKPAVESWVGPDRKQQDFLYYDRAIEIKSLFGNTRNTVQISSEDQLETSRPHLFLCVYHLVEQPSSDQAVSLNGLIREVFDSFTDSEVVELFSEKLVAAGYIDIREYDTPAYRVSKIASYYIKDDFPCIIRSSLPSAILKVSYDLKLPEISKYECELDKVWGP